MKSILRLSVLLAVASFTMGAVAQQVTGLWHGYIVVDKSTLPKPSTPQQQAEMAKRLQSMDAALAKSKITLTLGANKTFKMTAENVPGSAGTQSSEGTYTRAGTTITLQPKTENGKPATGSEAKPQAVSITNGGKNLALAIPNRGSVKIAIVFHR